MNITEFSDYIYVNNPYKEVNLQSADFVKTVIEKYIEVSKGLTSKTGVLTYYKAYNPAELKTPLSDVFFKLIYMSLKGIQSESDLQSSIKTNFDIALRDRIWIILSLMAKYAKTQNALDLWIPSGGKNLTPDTTPDVIPIESGINPVFIVAGIGAAILLLSKK